MVLYFFYRIASSLLPWLGVLNLLRRSLPEPEYRQRIRERFGYVAPELNAADVWIHAVSVGEVIAAAPLIESLISAYPQKQLLITSTTPAGSAEIQRRFGVEVEHCYLPFDAVRCVRRFINTVQPKTLLLMETELWPNLIREANRNGCSVYLLNARLSHRSAINYAKVKSLTNTLLAGIDHIVCQYQDTADRFESLGFFNDQLSVIGSVKFDLAISDELLNHAKDLKNTWRGDRLCWIAGSTHPTEEEIVLKAHLETRKKIPNLLLVLAPRHVHRCSSIIKLAESLGFKTSTLSTPPKGQADVLVVDQMGVLLSGYGMADVAFIGGSLQDTGGHNPIEPAVFQLPLLMGPNRVNFAEICRRFDDEGCLTTVNDAEEISEKLIQLLADEKQRRQQGLAALSVVEKNRGATAKQFQLVSNWLGPAS